MVLLLSLSRAIRRTRANRLFVGVSLSASTLRSTTSVQFRLSPLGSHNGFLDTATTKRYYTTPRRNSLGTSQGSPLKDRLPPGTWDGHMHVVEQRYPLAADATYRPSPHTFDQAIAFESSLGIENIVLVQPSVYGLDNSCLLGALGRIGLSHGRGVVVIDPHSIQADTLSSWNSLGVRGVRVNFRSVGKEPSQDELEKTLVEHADVARPLGWMIQIYTSLDQVPKLERIVPKLGVKVCLDHFGGPELPIMASEQGKPCDPYCLAGFSSLVALLQTGDTYVKISAPYRLSKGGDMRYLESMIRVFLQEAPSQVIYGTDWPHTRFSEINIEPFTELCLRMCDSNPGLAERVFRLNIEELLDGRT